MQLNPSGGPELHVWANTPLPAYIHVVLSNVSKKEEDGTILTGIDIFELFPVSFFISYIRYETDKIVRTFIFDKTGEETNYGGVNAKFDMRLIPASDVPELNTTIEMTPMVYRREVIKIFVFV